MGIFPWIYIFKKEIKNGCFERKIKRLLQTEWCPLPPKFICWTLTSNVCGDRACEVIKFKWGHKGRTLIWAGALLRRDTRAFSPPCRDTARRQPSASQEESPHQTLKWSAPWPSPLRLWENKFLLSKPHPTYGIGLTKNLVFFFLRYYGKTQMNILLWQPKKINAETQRMGSTSASIRSEVPRENWDSMGEEKIQKVWKENFPDSRKGSKLLRVCQVLSKVNF